MINFISNIKFQIFMIFLIKSFKLKILAIKPIMSIINKFFIN